MNSTPSAVLFGDLNMLRCFSGSSISTLLVTSDPDEVALRSKYCRLWRLIADIRKSPELALRRIISLGERLDGRPVLFYGDDALLLLVARHRDPH